MLLHIIFHNRILDVRILQCRHSFGFVPPLLKTLRTAMLQHHSNSQRKIIQIVSEICIRRNLVPSEKSETLQNILFIWMNTENNDNCGCIQYSALKCMVTSYWDAFPSAAPVVRYKIHKSDTCCTKGNETTTTRWKWYEGIILGKVSCVESGCMKEGRQLYAHNFTFLLLST